MEQAEVSASIHNLLLVSRLLDLNQELIDCLSTSLPEIKTEANLASLWFSCQVVKDKEFKKILINHTQSALANFHSINKLINLWFITPNKDLRHLISERLKQLSSEEPETIIKLSTIFQSKK